MEIRKWRGNKVNILYTKFWLVGLTEFQNSEAICANFLMERRELKHKREKLFLLKWLGKIAFKMEFQGLP